MPGKTFIANWKMHGRSENVSEYLDLLDSQSLPDLHRIIVCPPFTLVRDFCTLTNDLEIGIGGQDCHHESRGAFTGDVSADMLADTGATHVILGHSERRSIHSESSGLVCKKVESAWRAGLVAVVCVGESEDEHAQGRTLDVVTSQLAESVPDGARADNLILAYEPVWAIGTGKVPTQSGIASVHRHLNGTLAGLYGHGIRVLYGGSVNPDNAAKIMGIDGVNGCLVGGASLRGDSFRQIVMACKPG